MKMNPLDKIAMILVVIGGLNWGLVGFFKYDLVATIFGDLSMGARVVYSIVGLSALYLLLMMSKMMMKKPAGNQPS